MARDRESIDVSKDGLKTTLLTFIAGHASSLIVVGFLVVAYYYPVFDKPLYTFKRLPLSIESKIFICLLIILLLHPFSIFLDILGWALLGWMEKCLETFHFNRKTFLTNGTKNYLCFEALKQRFNLTSDNFYEEVRQKEYFLVARHRELMDELDFSLGSSIFLRNLTVCSFAIAIIYFLSGHGWLGAITVGIAIIFIIINSCVSFFYSLSILMFFSKKP